MAEAVRVTVVTPTYDRERWLPEAMRSVLEQGFPGTEYVVVDDGSTDGTERIVRGFGDRVRYHRQANAGQAAALNAGLALARGEFVAMVDDDDALLPGKLARQVPMLEAAPGAALVYSPVEYVDAEGRPLGGERQPRATPAGSVLRALLRENFVRTPAVLARTRVLREVGGFRPEIAHGNDLDLWLRVATRHPFLFDPVPSARVRHHGDQMIAERRRFSEAWVRILEDNLPRIERESPGDAAAARRELARRCLRLGRLDLREGREEDAAARIGRALALVPRLRLEAWRIRLVEKLRRKQRF
jgi:glycosyltransferase involved in cell wall biosynthesis